MPPSSQISFVLAIEGYEYLIHAGGFADDASVIASWGGSGWTLAHPGLKVRGTIRQKIEPWSETMDVPTLTFEIQSTPDDRFGKAVWKSRPDYRSRLRSPFKPALDGTGILDVDATIDDSVLSDNALFIGGQRLRVTQATPNTWTVLEAGSFHPFHTIGGQRYFRSFDLSDQQGFSAAPPPHASSTPGAWTGRMVALYTHTIKGGRWNSRSQARLEFAGRIVDIADDPKTGSTVLGCEALNSTMRDSVLLKRQWTGHVQRGVRLETGWIFRAVEQNLGAVYAKNPLTVVASGASGDFQVNAGYHELGDFMALLNTYLASNSGWVRVSTGGVTPRPADQAKWSCGLATGSGGGRTFQLDVLFAAALTWQARLYCTSSQVFSFLGFDSGGDFGWTRGRDFERYGISRDLFYIGGFASEGDVAEMVAQSPNPPYVVKPFQTPRRWTELVGRVDLEKQDGEWLEHTTYLPPPYDTWATSDENWSLFTMGDRIYFGRYNGTNIDNVSRSLNFAGYAEAGVIDSYRVGKTVEDDDDRFDISQVVCMVGSFADLFTKIIVSTDGRGMNHPTFDVFSGALGGPAIPWALLGQPWLDGIRHLDQAVDHEAILVFLDRPTRFMDLFLSELLLRFAWLIFKDGTYQLRSPPAPNPLRTDWTLNDENKAGPAGQPDQLIAATAVTTRFLVNVIKVDYNRLAGSGGYANSLIVRDEVSIGLNGESQAATISAFNSYSDAAGTGTSVEALAANLIARVLPAFSKPMKTVDRAIAPNLFGMTPGDTVTLSDAVVRNPVSGERGLVSRGCTCIAVSYSFGHEGGDLFGTATLLFTDEDRTFPLAPAADIDTDFSGTVDGITFTSGYAATAAGGPALKLKSYTYSRPIFELPDLELFAPGDRVRLYEIDPPAPAAPLFWDRQLNAGPTTFRSLSNGWLKLTADLVSPTYNAAKEYRLTFQRHSEVNDSQQLWTYLADDDGLIEDEAEANTFGEEGMVPFDRSLTPDAVRYRLPPTFIDDDGRPLHPGVLYDHMVNINNLLSYTCAPQASMIHYQHHATNLDFYTLTDVFPFFFGLSPTTTAHRKLMIGPILRTSVAAATVRCRVTSSKFPPHGPSDQHANFIGPFKQHEFLLTGTTSDILVNSVELECVHGDDSGMTWISVELSISGLGAVGQFRGFHRLILLPITVPP